MAQSKIQLNIRLDGKTNAAFDALAYKMGLDRPGLGHRMVDEMLAADAQGRELFDRSYDFDPRQAAEQVQKIAAVADETERRMRDIAKREAEVATLRRDDAERMSVARSELLGSLATRLSTAYEPFKLKIEELGALIREMPALAQVNDKLDRTEKLASEPRHQTNIVWGQNGVWTLPFLAAALMLGSLVLFVVLMSIASTFSGTRTFVADRLFQTDQAVCGYLDGRYGPGCKVAVQMPLEAASSRRKQTR